MRSDSDIQLARPTASERISRPILFSAPMIRRLPGIEPDPARWKTQTRRILKPQPPEWVKVWNGNDGREHFFFDREEDDDCGQHWPSYAKGLRCPYGKPGDLLWVRETWSTWTDTDSYGCIVYRADNSARRLLCEENGQGDPVAVASTPSKPMSEPPNWRPSIFMPRWASRIALEVTSVRVERLQTISTMDAMAEGVDPRPVADGTLSYTHGFRTLWDAINGAESWDANPWVWVVGFKGAEVRR